MNPVWQRVALLLAVAAAACGEELDPRLSSEGGAADAGPNIDARPSSEEGAPDTGRNMDAAEASVCPSRMQAPLGEACEQAEQTCRYGYEPPECGGRTVVCRGGAWIELEHSDPQSSCIRRDAGKPDTRVPQPNPVILPDASDPLCTPYSPTGEGCAYVETPGVATVTAFETPTEDDYSCMNDPRVVRFSFVPDDPRRARCLREQPSYYETLTVSSGANPPRSCLDAEGISVGTALRVTRMDIAFGSCTPVVYQFEQALVSACLSACRF